MLKLQSKGGKFDIVISDASLKDVGGVKKNNLRSLSSAGRRKTREVKGHHILPDHKDESPRLTKEKENRVNPGGKAKDERTLKKSSTGKFSSRQDMDTKSTPSTGASKTSQLVSSKSKPGTEARLKPKNIGSVPNQKSSSNTSKDLNGVGVISQSQLMSIVESLNGDDVSALQSAMAMKEKNKKPLVLNGNKKENTNTVRKPELNSSIIEPNFVPGLNLQFNEASAEDRSYTSDARQYDKIPNERSIKAPFALSEAGSAATAPDHLHWNDSISTISVGETSGMNHALNEQSANTSPNGRAERIAMRSSFAIGAPGQVAYDYNQTNRAKNKQWLADLAKQIQEKKEVPLSDKERLARAMENPASITTRSNIPRPKVESSPIQNNSKKTLKKSPVVAEPMKSEPEPTHGSPFYDSSPTQRNFARGQHSTKNQFEIDDIERQRKKLLEHQRAVEQQVEEKRRLKMIERERRIKEEWEEEEKLAKEREQLAWQHELESRKQLEREEAERQRHEALQRSVLEAYDAAKKEKLNVRLRKLRAKGHDVSRLEHNSNIDSLSINEGEISEIEKELSRLTIPSVSVESSHLVTSRSDKGFRPILNLNDDDQKEKERKKSKDGTSKEGKQTKYQKSERGNLKKSRDALAGEKTEVKTKKDFKKSDTKRIPIYAKKQKEKEIDNGKAKGSQKNTRSDDVGRNLVTNFKRNVAGIKRQDYKKSERLLIKHGEISENDWPELNTLDGDDNDQYGSETQRKRPSRPYSGLEGDGELAYNRSSTVNLEESLSPRQGVSATQSRLSYHLTKDESSDWDTLAFPTERQQKILDELQAIRKGLLHKQREYERGTTPSTVTY